MKDFNSPDEFLVKANTLGYAPCIKDLTLDAGWRMTLDYDTVDGLIEDIRGESSQVFHSERTGEQRRLVAEGDREGDGWGSLMSAEEAARLGPADKAIGR